MRNHQEIAKQKKKRGTCEVSCLRFSSCTATKISQVARLLCSARHPDSCKLLLASGIEGDEWLEGLRQKYKSCSYFTDFLVALGGQRNAPEAACEAS